MGKAISMAETKKIEGDIRMRMGNRLREIEAIDVKLAKLRKSAERSAFASSKQIVIDISLALIVCAIIYVTHL